LQNNVTRNGALDGPGGLRFPKVRKTPSWPEAGPNSAFYHCITTGMHGPTWIFWANLTLLSLQPTLVKLNVGDAVILGINPIVTLENIY
jgi:hypothetical protein